MNANVKNKHPQNRAERRELRVRKWEARLRRLWRRGWLNDRIFNVKSDRSIRYEDCPRAESFKDYRLDKFGLLLKNTGTAMTNLKELDSKEVHKRDKKNREIPEEEWEG